ncbi:PMS1 protein homolog 1-like isoform X2 [Babylonia areolata]|uniref:PMS1 protein homolog 1-like isoform X2 n=1 Tax=Babylonia areolata TaxID=304850 RepID=UPI003FD5FA01
MAAVSGGKMNYLSASTIRLLGSTQVITSVYSVVKELIENSLDAGAKSIEVKLENYGLDKIEVRDNGSGISSADIPVVAKRHFTSKITSQADLETLASYGFRGEALASLCAVSEVSVTTKTEAEDVSHSYTFNSEGDITCTVPSHLGQGTTVCAKHLFKNLPVRKQYHSSVKKKKDDLKNVENLLLAYSVILPAVRLSLRHNKEVVWQKVVLEDTAAVLQIILGKSVARQMEWSRRNVEDPQMQLELCVPKAGSDVSSLSRSTADRSFLCINGRPVVVKEIDKLVRQYYNNCHGCETSRHPVYFFGVTLPSRDLDVNLDPNKTSVMATSMPTVLEQLEEMLLYIYGPLDQAPSWRYRDREEGKDKTPAADSGNGMSVSVLERLRKAPPTERGDDGDSQDSAQKKSTSTEKNVAEKSSSPSTAAVISFESAPGVEKRQIMLHNSAGNDSDNVKPPAEVHASSSSKSTCGDDEAYTKERGENNNCTDQQDKQTLNTDDHNSNVSKGSFSGRLSPHVPQDVEMEKSSEPVATSSAEILMNNTAARVVESVKEKTSKMTREEELVNVTTGDDGQTGSEISKKTDRQPGTSGWSLGTSVRSESGTVVQPVRLLAPSPVRFPGKRPLAASPDQGTPPPQKRGRKLSPAKSTLYDMINNTAVKRPMAARDFFFKDKRPTVVEANPHADYDEVTDRLAKMWDELPEESRVIFREKCWYDTQRYNKEVAAAKNVTGKIKASVSTKAKPMSVRDMVAASSTQPSPGRAMKKKVVLPSAPVTDVEFSMTQLESSVHLATSFREVYFTGTQVLGGLPSCQAWLCGRGKELCILNAHRLSEAVVFHRLMDQHRLGVHHCHPVTLTRSNTGGFWSTLENLAGPSCVDTFSHMSDSRITHNGFDVKYWRDGEGQLCGELVGACGDVPTYGVKDLVELLQLIANNSSSSSSSSLACCRPLKVINYLKGEAVRMVRQQAGERTAEDVQDLLEESAGLLPSSCRGCLHDRPFFHTLLTDIDSALPSEECAADSPVSQTQTEEEVVEEEGVGGVGKDESGGGGGGGGVVSFDQLMSLDDLMDF